MSRKILDLARDQQNEVAREMGDEEDQTDEEDDAESWVLAHICARARLNSCPYRSTGPREAERIPSEDEGQLEEGDAYRGEEYAELVRLGCCNNTACSIGSGRSGNRPGRFRCYGRARCRGSGHKWRWTDIGGHNLQQDAGRCCHPRYRGRR